MVTVAVLPAARLTRLNPLRDLMGASGLSRLFTYTCTTSSPSSFPLLVTGMVILGILWIPVMRSIGDVLYTYLQDVQSVLAPGIAAAFLMGIIWKRASAKGGMWGLITGFVIGLTRLGAKVFYTSVETANHSGLFYSVFYETNWLFFCGWMFLFCILVIVVVSLFTKAPEPALIQGLVFGTATDKEKAETRASWNAWDIINTLIILGITAAFYWYFW